MNRIALICMLMVAAAQLFADETRYGNEAIVSNDVINIHVADDMPDRSTFLVTTNHVLRTNDSFYCTIHQQELYEGTAEVIYGLLIRKEGLQAAEDALFPHAADYIWGGCVTTDNSLFTPKSLKVLYCPRCRQAKAEWRANENHGGQQGGPGYPPQGVGSPDP